MATNPFDQFGYADEVPAGKPVVGGAPAPAAIPQNQNPFDSYGYADAEPASAYVPPKPPSSFLQGAKDISTEIWQGFNEEGAKLGKTLGLAVSFPAALWNSINTAVGGQTPEEGEKWKQTITRSFVTPFDEAQAERALPPEAPLTKKIGHAVGNMAGTIAEIVATGGGAAPEVAVGKTALEGVTQTATHAARAMQLPAVSNAVNTGKDVLDKTGDMNAAVKAAQASYFTTVASGIAPLSAPGGLATRLATGAASGTAIGEAGRQLQNAAMPDNMQTPFSAEDLAINAGTTALMGGTMGPRATARQKPPGVHSAVDAVESAQDKARAEVEAGGGDKLDQELAAAKAGALEGALHDQHFENQAIEDVRTHLDSVTNNEFMLQVQQMDQDAAKQQAFAQAEQQRGIQRGKEEKEAEYQKAINTGTERAAVEEAIEPYRPSETSGATLGDVMPEALKARVQKKGMYTESVQTPEVDKLQKLGTSEEVTREVQPAEKAAEVRAETPEAVEPVAEAAKTEPANELAKRREIEEAAHEAATSPKNDLAEPTEAQKAAGNYKKGHVEVQGMDISIENPIGSTRSGTTPEGRPWSRDMQDHYGYIRRSEGADGDHVDAFIGSHPDSEHVYVVDQMKQATGGFDEHKAMIGYRNQLDAVRAYKRNFQKGWKVGPVTEMTVPEFKDWIKNGDTTKAIKPMPEATPASEADVAQMAGPESKRGIQRIRYKLGDEIPPNAEAQPTESNYERLATNAVTQRTRVQTEPYYDKAAASASSIAGRTVPETKLSARRAAMQAPEKGIAVVKTGDSEWTVFNDRKAEQVYTNEQSAYDDLFAADTDARTEQDAESARYLKEQTQQGIPVDEARAALSTKLGGIADQIQVHESPKELPEGLRARFEKQNPADMRHRIKGFYNPDTGEAHVFSSRHADVESLGKTALHELVGHKGTRAVLRDRFESVMQDIHDNGSRKELEEIARRYNLDLTKKSDQITAADEYVAHLAEHGQDSPLLHRVVAAVRSGLRRLGLVKGWSNEDIRHLLRQSYKALGSQNADAVIADRRIRNSLGEPDPIVKEQPDNPLSQLAKFGATSESQAKYSPDLLHRVRDSLANFGESKGRSAIQGFLGAIPLDKLQDFVGKNKEGKSKIPAIERYAATLHKMSGRRNALFVETETTAKKWMKLQRRDSKAAADVANVMHAVALAGVDPSVEYAARKQGKSQTLEDRRAEVERRASYSALKPFWDRLPPDAKALYKEVQQTYQQQRARIENALNARIADSDASPDSKSALMAELRKQFESSHVSGPYFPLSRFGEYWGSAKNRAGEVVAASRFETPQELKTWREQFGKSGYVTDGGRNMDAARTANSINPEFVGKVTELVKDMNPQIADSVWQMYLQSLPELSMRHAFQHRKGRLGFSQDALRAFGSNMFHGAHQLARLEYTHKLEGHLRSMEKQVHALETSEDPEAKWARPLASEISTRHKWVMNPDSSPGVNALTSLGFVYHLIASPAAGVVNLTQTPIVAGPILAGEFGAFRAGKELLKASTEIAGARVKSLGKEDVKSGLKGDELRAMTEAEQAGSFGRTQAHLLAGASSEEGLDLTSKRRQAMEIASWYFHKTEEFNRKATFLAAFRLGKNKGLSYDEAFDKADKLTMDAHFDVSNANRARYMQSGPAKVLTLFKNYALNMTYRLARDFRESVRLQTSDPEARTAAQKRFAGMMGMTALFAGASGLPMSWLVHAVINTVFSDPDTDFDSESAFRAYLTQTMGSKWAQTITRGPFESATGLSVSDRVGLNNLWIQTPPENKEGQDLNWFYAQQVAGPALSPFLGIAPAVQQMHQGYYERALEGLLPKSGADVAKALRYMREGATDTKGNTIMSKDEFTAKQLFFQSIGFVPAELAQHNAQNRAVKAAEQKILKRRELLLDQFALALRNQDQDGKTEALQNITEFDKKNPSVAIGGQNIVNSLMQRAKFNARQDEGLTIDPRLGYLHNKYRFTPKEEETK